MNQVFILFLEIVVGGITLYGYRVRNSSGISMKDLIKELEKKDREIERLKIARHASDLRHKHLESQLKGKDLLS